MTETIRVGLVNTSTPGADTNTYILFDSTVTFGVNIAGDVRNGTLIAHEISRVMLSLVNAAAGTLKAYRSVDKGTNWDQVGGDIAVAASPATDVNGPYDFLTDAHPDFRISWVNGGSSQASGWRPSVTMIRNYHGPAT